MKIEMKTEIIVPNIKDYEYVEVVKQEEIKIEYEEPLEEVKQQEVKIEYEEHVEDGQEEKIKYVEKVIQEVKLEYEYDDSFDDPVEEKDVLDSQVETFAEKSDNPRYNLRHRCTTSQIQETSLKNVKRSNKSKSPYYECKKCFEKFPDFKRLKKHREEIKHPRNAYNPSSCPVCNKVIEYTNKKQHMRTHTGEKPYCCEICGASFSQSSSLHTHKRARHFELNDQMYQCPTCEKCFKSLNLLQNHQTRGKEAKNSSRNFQCVECDQQFTTKTLLLQHSAIHGAKKFWCCVCGKGFVRIGLLNIHSKVHTGLQPYVCDVCGKAFSQTGNLKRHKLIHAGKKLNVCSVCGKAFVLPSSLRYHTRIHTGEKPYSCEIIHTGEKPYSCGICGKSFAMNSSLIVHKITHLGNSFFLRKSVQKGHSEQNLVPPHELVTLPTLIIKQ